MNWSEAPLYAKIFTVTIATVLFFGGIWIVGYGHWWNRKIPIYSLRVKENSLLMKIIAKILFFNPRFMGSFVTTIGSTIYAPGGHITRITLQHELVHVADYGVWGPLFILSYLPLRAYWELRAYRVTILETLKMNPDYARSPQFKAKIIGHFTSAEYLYMWPFPKWMSRWFDRVLQEGK